MLSEAAVIRKVTAAVMFIWLLHRPQQGIGRLFVSIQVSRAVDSLTEFSFALFPDMGTVVV